MKGDRVEKLWRFLHSSRIVHNISYELGKNKTDINDNEYAYSYSLINDRKSIHHIFVW